MLTPEATRQYREWRRRIRFTDVEIAQALEERARGDPELRAQLFELARRARRGYVGKAAVNLAGPFLAKVCDICGAKALYHCGADGRCSEHRAVTPGWYRPASASYEAEAERDALAEERRELGLARFKAGRKRRK